MKLNPSRFSQEEFVNNHWTVTAEEGMTVEDLLKPEFFGNVAFRMRPYDRITARVDTGEWYAELLVKSCGRTWANVAVLYQVDLTTSDVDMSQAQLADQFEIKFRGPHLKHCVIRTSDNECIKEGCDTKAEAQSWLASYMLTI